VKRRSSTVARGSECGTTEVVASPVGLLPKPGVSGRGGSGWRKLPRGLKPGCFFGCWTRRWSAALPRWRI